MRRSHNGHLRPAVHADGRGAIYLHYNYNVKSMMLCSQFTHLGCELVGVAAAFQTAAARAVVFGSGRMGASSERRKMMNRIEPKNRDDAVQKCQLVMRKLVCNNGAT